MSLKGVLNAIATIADTPTSTDDEKISHSFLIYLGLFMAVGGVIWGTITIWVGLAFQSVIPYAYAVITLFNFTYLRYTKNFLFSQILQVAISLLLPFFFQIVLGGFIASGGVILWSVLTILGGFTFLERSVTIRWFIGYIVLVIVSGLVDQYISYFGITVPHVPTNVSVLFFTLNITLISTIIFGLFYYFLHTNNALQHKLHILANTDSLSGLRNRRSFFIKAELEFLRAKRYDRPFSLLMVDIDLFKTINDTHGHDVGDEVIERFAHLLAENSREVDILGRYGGEEFILLLPETSIKDIRERALRLLKSTQEMVIHTPKTNFSFTISIGIAQLKPSDENFSMVLKRADEALYKAKQLGRNQVQEVH